MSVQMQIDRISANISQTYSVLSDAGADIPETANSDNLPDTARSIKAVLYDRTQNLTDEQKVQARENIGAQPVGNYALKTEIPSVPVQSVNGKAGAVNLTASDVKARPDSWMPTAQDVGALPSTYTPPNQTAQQVGALASSGGDMTGAINMNGHPISGLNDPTEDTQAARKGYVDTAKEEVKAYTDSKRKTWTATITTTWSGSGPYTQSVAVPGILASDMPHITPIYSSENATALAQKESWACVSKAVTAANSITFACFEDKPAAAIPIQIEVIR